MTQPVLATAMSASTATRKHTNDQVLVVGAGSGIARALVEELAPRSSRLVLAGRDVVELERTASDLSIRHGLPVEVLFFDARDFDAHESFMAEAIERCGGDLGGVVVCYGHMQSQEDAARSEDVVRDMLDVNFTSVATLLNVAARHFEARRNGFIVALSSVAGDRGRQSNYCYGAAKAGLTAYLSGLRNRLAASNVQVLTVKPGFVDTPMTRGLLNPKSPLVAQPERVARDIVRAIERRRDVIYTPWFWFGIMSVICAIPERIFKRLKL